MRLFLARLVAMLPNAFRWLVRNILPHHGVKPVTRESLRSAAKSVVEDVVDDGQLNCSNIVVSNTVEVSLSTDKGGTQNGASKKSKSK